MDKTKTFVLIGVVLTVLVLVAHAVVVVDDELTVIRDISEQTVGPGSTFTVTLTLTTNEWVIAPALDENLPDGWTVSVVDNAGAIYKASTTEWIWLSAIPSGESRTVIYDVAVPDDATPQDYEITGYTSAYGTDPIEIGGESTVTVEVCEALSANRDISEQTVGPGSTFTVTLTLTANEEVIAPALDENLPDGWTVTEVDYAGALYKASTSEWIWLSVLLAGESGTIIYNVTVPDDAAPQDYEITGYASAYSVTPIETVGESTVTVEAYEALSANRDISEQTVGQGSTFTVTLTLTADREVIAPALDENLPDGWTVTEVDYAGALYKASTSEWIWLSVLPAGESRTVIYDVTVPEDAAPQDYEITGYASAYSVTPIETVGESTVTVIGRVEATGGVVINEFVSDNTTEWVELYNNGTTPVDLTNWTLKDGGRPAKTLSGTIPAGDYIVFSYSSGWLNNGGDIIHLNSTTANIDRVTYGDWDDGNIADNAPVPGSGESTGRYPNGVDTDDDAADFQSFDTPTGWADNV